MRKVSQYFNVVRIHHYAQSVTIFQPLIVNTSLSSATLMQWRANINANTHEMPNNSAIDYTHKSMHTHINAHTHEMQTSMHTHMTCKHQCTHTWNANINAHTHDVQTSMHTHMTCKHQCTHTWDDTLPAWASRAAAKWKRCGWRRFWAGRSGGCSLDMGFRV